MLLMMVSVLACKQQDLDLYEAAPSIYFPNSEINDGDHVSFGYVSGYVTDSIIGVLVRTTGSPVDYDRPYTLDIAANSTLREGVDFEFVSAGFAIPANEVSDLILIKLLRNSTMTEDTLGMYMELIPNDHFSTELFTRTVGSGTQQQTRHYTRRYLLVDDIAGIPWFWDLSRNASASIYLGYLGEFSGRKFQLMIGRFGLDIDQVTAPNYRPAVTTILAWGFGMQAYLNEMAGNGTPILEADGMPMVMGQFAQ